MSPQLAVFRVTRVTTLALALASAASTAVSQVPVVPSTTPFVNRMLFMTAATNAGASATNVIDFQDFGPFGAAMGSGFIPAFTELGFVRFNVTSNYQQEVIDGFNVGSPNNNVYMTLAGDKTLPIADVTFGRGVQALGFDFKDAAGNGSAGLVPQLFTFNLFSGGTNLGSFTSSTMPGGTMFSFAGFTSTAPITELIITSLNASPNQDVVLDNFALSNQVDAAVTTPEPVSVVLFAAGLLVTGVVARRQRGRTA